MKGKQKKTVEEKRGHMGGEVTVRHCEASELFRTTITRFLRMIVSTRQRERGFEESEMVRQEREVIAIRQGLLRTLRSQNTEQHTIG